MKSIKRKLQPFTFKQYFVCSETATNSAHAKYTKVHSSEMALGLSNNANNKEKIFNWHLTNVNVLLFETGKVCIFYSDSEGFLTVELM